MSRFPPLTMMQTVMLMTVETELVGLRAAFTGRVRLWG